MLIALECLCYMWYIFQGPLTHWVMLCLSFSGIDPKSCHREWSSTEFPFLRSCSKLHWSHRRIDQEFLGWVNLLLLCKGAAGVVGLFRVTIDIVSMDVGNVLLYFICLKYEQGVSIHAITQKLAGFPFLFKLVECYDFTNNF